MRGRAGGFRAAPSTPNKTPACRAVPRPQAEASLATNAAALKDLESKLAAGPDAGAVEKERSELQVGLPAQ